MDVRYAIHQDHLKLMDTGSIRKHLLIEKLFEKDQFNMVYSHVDRIIVGGVCPADRSLSPQTTRELGVDFFLQRRELGIINLGFKGIVVADSVEYALDNKECIYIGMGVRELSFGSANRDEQAKFYFASSPRMLLIPPSN